MTPTSAASPPMAMPPMSGMPPMPMAMPPMSGMPPMGGMMPMSFYAGWRNVQLLFASWMPTSQAGFALSCLVIMLAAVVETVLRKFSVRVERRLMRSPMPVLKKNACRAAITFVQSTLSYSIMLLAMTFDVYVFFSIIMGFTLGTLVSGHWNDSAAAGLSTATWESVHSELRLSVMGMTCDTCCRSVENVLLAVPGVESAVVDLQSGRATVVCASVPVATLIAAVEATGKRCRVEGEQRSFTIVRSGKPTQDSDAALLLTQPPDACCR